MKTRSHKKYRKRGVTKSRRNKVGGSNIFKTITDAIGLTTPQVVVPLQQSVVQPVVQPVTQPVTQPVVQEVKPYIPGKVNKRKINKLQKVEEKRTLKYKK